jgi:hypothetical protein
MKALRRSIVVTLMVTCSACRAVSDQPVERIAHPLLTFEVIDIPAPGKAQGVTGVVELLVPSSGWTALRDGTPLVDGSQLRIDAGARLEVRFSDSQRMEFRPAPAERWVQLRAVARDSHGT